MKTPALVCSTTAGHPTQGHQPWRTAKPCCCWRRDSALVGASQEQCRDAQKDVQPPPPPPPPWARHAEKRPRRTSLVCSTTAGHPTRGHQPWRTAKPCCCWRRLIAGGSWPRATQRCLERCSATTTTAGHGTQRRGHVGPAWSVLPQLV